MGSIIVGIGGYSLISSIGLQTVNIHETFDVGKSTSYQILANAGASQHMKITGEKFNLKLSSPGSGLKIPPEGDSFVTHEKEVTIDWVHLEDGVTRIQLQNLGSTEMTVEAKLHVSTDPILFSYHFIVIISGMIIIGFSMGFTLRKPKGF